MKALVKTKPGPGLTLTEVAEPVVGPTDVLIAVTHAAICGTDLHIYEWDAWAADTMVTPVTVGHEFVGRIAAVGRQVDTDVLRVGTRVVGEGHIICGTCRNCRAGDGHLCRKTVGVGVHRDGGFAELVTIPAANAYAVPDGIPDEIAAILDPLGNAVHTALSFDLVGEDVLITGAGPIGQMAAAVARHAGARHVVVTDISRQRLDLATQLGASRAIHAGEASIREAMSELGIVEGFDVALEMSGDPAAMHDILSTINHGGKVALLGLYPEAPDIDLNQAILKGLTIKGIYGREMFDTWYKATSMLGSGLNVSPVITHRFPFADYEKAFESLKAGTASKVVLEIGSSGGVETEQEATDFVVSG